MIPPCRVRTLSDIIPTMEKKRILSPFEQLILNSYPEIVTKLKQELLIAWEIANMDVPTSFQATKNSREKLRFAVEKMDTEPEWFLNLNPIYRDVITQKLEQAKSALNNQ